MSTATPDNEALLQLYRPRREEPLPVHTIVDALAPWFASALIHFDDRVSDAAWPSMAQRIQKVIGALVAKPLTDSAWKHAQTHAVHAYLADACEHISPNYKETQQTVQGALQWIAQGASKDTALAVLERVQRAAIRAHKQVVLDNRGDAANYAAKVVWQTEALLRDKLTVGLILLDRPRDYSVLADFVLTAVEAELL